MVPVCPAYVVQFATTFQFLAHLFRVLFGPCTVWLQPFEMFSVLYVTGESEKGMIGLPLGPEKKQVTLKVKTSDHVKLNVKVGYTW